MYSRNPSTVFVNLVEYNFVNKRSVPNNNNISPTPFKLRPKEKATFAITTNQKKRNQESEIDLKNDNGPILLTQTASV